MCAHFEGLAINAKAISRELDSAGRHEEAREERLLANIYRDRASLARWHGRKAALCEYHAAMAAPAVPGWDALVSALDAV